MEQEKHNLESLFRKQLDASPPAFDPSYWDRAQKEIEQLEKQRKRRRYGLFFLLALGLLCLVAGGYWLFSPTQTTNPITEQATVPTVPHSPSVIEVEPKTDVNENQNESKNEKPGLDSGFFSDENDSKPTRKVKARNLAANMTMSISPNIEDKPAAISINREEHEALPGFEKKSFSLNGIAFLKGERLEGNKDLVTGSLRIEQFFRSTYHVYAEAGLGANPSFATAAEQQWHYAPYYEFGLHRLLSRRLGLEAGLGYSAIAGINRSLAREDLSYSFIGSRRSQTLTHQQSHWLSLPLRVEYRLASSLKLRLGMRLSYLMQTHGSLETVNENDLGIKTTSSEQVRQYMDGLRRMNYQVEAGLSYCPAARWEIQARAIRGLNSITHGDVLRGGGQDRSMQLQLGVRWYLK